MFVEAQENQEQPLPNLTVGDDDYLTTRDKKQGDRQDKTGPYDGYYDPRNVKEPFNFRDDRNLNNYPGNDGFGNGYSGY